MRLHHILLLSFLVATAGCGEGQSTTQTEVPVTTLIDSIDGIPHVRNSGTPPTWPLEEVVRLGSAASLGEPKPDEFGGVSSVALGPGGRIYVADWLNYEVRVFSATGSFEFAFGRNGEGPGEFGALYSLAWVGDTLLTLDFGVGRVGMFSPNGDWLGQHRLPGSVSGSPRELRFYQTSPSDAYAWSLENTGADLTNVFIHYTSLGPGAVIPEFNTEPRPQSMVICRHPEGSIHFWDIPFAPKLVQHPLQGGLRAIALSDQYRIAVINAAGDTIRVIEKDQLPVPVRDVDWEAGLQEYRDYEAENPSASCEPRILSKPDFIPPIVDLLADPSGYLWVQAETQDGPYWEVFDEAGVLLGRVPDFPRGDRTAPYFSDGKILNVESDSLGVETVHLYRYSRTSGR